MKKIISFVIPIYHVGKQLLTNCVESILKQSYEDIEILLIDDGSTEEDALVCDDFSRRDIRVRAIHCKNQGVSVARNIGIENAVGDWIIFVDPDDTVSLDLAQICINAISQREVDILLYKSTFSSNGKSSNTEKLEEVDVRNILEISTKVIGVIDEEFDYGACWGKMFNKSFLKNNTLRFVPGIKKAQDRIFMLDSYQKAKRLAKIDFIGYMYNDSNEASICKRYNPKITSILTKTATEFHRHIEEYNIPEYYIAEDIMNVRFIYEMLQLYLLHKSYEVGLWKRKREIKNFITSYQYKDCINRVELNKLSKKCAVVCVLLRFKLYSLLTIAGYLYLNRS